MTMSSHLTELKKKHETLEKKIEDEQRSPGSDDLTIASLKKQKLRLKDEIQKFATAKP